MKRDDRNVRFELLERSVEVLNYLKTLMQSFSSRFQERQQSEHYNYRLLLQILLRLGILSKKVNCCLILSEKTSISFPSFVGLAGCPWVLASMGTS